MSRAPKTKPAPELTETLEAEILGIKGYDRNLKCRDFQFEIGKTYEHVGPVVACQSGFHAIEGHPLEAFGYYPPGISRYTETKQRGKLARHSGDSKVASAVITTGVELSVHDLITRAVKWVFDRSKPEGETATGTRGAASSTGTRGAASSTGYQGAASSTGTRGAAMAVGYSGKVMGADGNALFLTYRDPNDGKVLHAWAGIAGQNGIKPTVWYLLGADGQPIEVVS